MRWIVCLGVGVVGLLCAACGDDGASDDATGGSGGTGAGASGGTAGAAGSGTGGASGGTAGAAGSGTGGASGGTAGAAGSGTGGAGTGGAGTGGATGTCDYQVGSNGVLVIEAEKLKLSASWKVNSQASGAYGSGYIEWTGPSQNSKPGVGLISVKLGIDQPGRYRMQWRSRIGAGTNTTEHNDTWVRFPDAAAFYGMKAASGGESRRYPKPQCDDSTFMAKVLALPNVTSATCPSGSTASGWFKVYCSGASDWKWSTNTSDNDAHQIYAEFAQAGTYTLELSARADLHLIDRIVIHRETVADGVATAAGAPATPCQ
jgi:hypothetical protein